MYPAAYRSGAARQKAGSAGFQKPPAPFRPQTRPPAVNDNIPSPANDNFRRSKALGKLVKGGGILARRLPYVGWALLAWDAFEFLRQMPSPIGLAKLPNGWTKTLDCGGPPTLGPWPIQYSGCPSAGYTAISETSWGNNYGKVGEISDRWRCSYFSHLTNPAGSTVRLWYRQEFEKPKALYRAPQPYPHVNPLQRLKPERLPVFDPVVLPPAVPEVPDPEPVPYALVPHRPRSPFADVGYGPSTRTSTGRNPTGRRPPRKDEVEKKAKTRSAAVLALVGVRYVTEMLDVVDAFWNALPDEITDRHPKAPPQKKVEVIVREFEDIDLSDLFFELLWNHYSDKYFGRAQGLADKFGRDLGPAGDLSGVTWGNTLKETSAPLGEIKKQLKTAWDAGIDVFAGT